MSKQFYSVMLLTLFIGGIAIGSFATVSEYSDKLATNEHLINTKVENAIEQKFSEKEANMQLYEAIYYDHDKDQTRYFFFRSDDNPFWRANEIMEKESVEFSNLRIKESKLLEEEK